MLKWVFERVTGTASAVETAIGYLPGDGSLDIDGLDVAADDMATLLAVDAEGWEAAIPQIRIHYAQFGATLPTELDAALDTLEAKLASA